MIQWKTEITRKVQRLKLQKRYKNQQQKVCYDYEKPRSSSVQMLYLLSGMGFLVSYSDRRGSKGLHVCVLCCVCVCVCECVCAQVCVHAEGYLDRVRHVSLN